MRADVLVAATLISAPVLAQSPEKDGIFEAAWDSISGGPGETVVERPSFTDGTDLVTAIRGTYTQNEAGARHWTLEGDLSVILGTAELTAERGSFEFGEAGELVRGSISGQPVSLSAIDNDSGETLRGTANAFSLTQTPAGARHWTLDGDLSVALGTAELTGERGTFEFSAAGELDRGSVSGQPVSLQAIDNVQDRDFAGSAETITLDADSTTLQLLGRTILSVRTGEREPDTYQGCDWIYNWQDHSFRKGASDCAVRLVITPMREDLRNGSAAVPP